MREKETSQPESQRTGEENSVFELLLRQSQRFPDHDLLVLPEAVAALWDAKKTQWTYSETVEQVRRLADRYRSAGYGPGSRVALLLENRPEHFFHWLALNAVGASAVPVNPDYTASELTYLLDHSEARALIHLPSRTEQAHEGARAAGVAIVASGSDKLPHAGRAAAPASGRKTECALIYTSGTTGRPKGCILSNAYFLGWRDWYSAQGGLIALRTGQERLMTPLPAFHVNAMGNSFMGMLGTGGAQIIVDRFHPRSWWGMAVETGATCFHYLGVMPAILLAVPPGDFDTAHRLRFGMGGGVHPDHHAAFERRFHVPLLEGWAMTETGGAGILCAMEEPRHVGQRNLGRPDRTGPAMQVRLVDEDGHDVPPEEPGELLLRADGPDPRRQFFSGYLKDEEATEAIWQGGWLHTGDIMRRDAAGSLYFVDRKKNIIRRSGENIAAIEVEAAVVSHPDVRQVAVIAVPDPMRGEEVLAAIVPNAGNTPDRQLAQSIFDHCAETLAYYKLPGFLAFLEHLPTTSTQKIRKSDLGALAEEPLGQPDCYDLRAEKQARRALR